MKTETVQLGDVCEFVRGITFPSGEGKPVPFENSIACLTTSGVQQDVAWNSRRFVQRSRVSHTKQMLRAGDILISTANSKELVGKSCLVDQTPFPCTFGAFVTVARSQEAVYPPYLAYWMTTREYLAWCFKNSSNTTNISNLRVSELEELRIALPSLSEQQQIGRRLEQADRLRRTRRYALELTDTFLPAAFLKLFGDPTTNPLGLPVAELGDFLSFVTSGSRGWAEHYVPEGSRFIRSLDVRMNNISDEDAVFVKPPNNAEADRTRVKPADVLLTITGSRIGRVAPVPERLSGAFISQHVAILRLKAGLLPEFLSMFLSLDTGGQRQIARAQYGQTKPGLNLNQIREMRVPVPDVCHQQRFLKLAKRVERLRAVQREALRQAEHLFASLLHCAFSG